MEIHFYSGKCTTMQIFWTSNFRKSSCPPTTRPGNSSISPVDTCRALWRRTILILPGRSPPSPATTFLSGSPFTVVSGSGFLWCRSTLTLPRRWLCTVDSTGCACNCCWCRSLYKWCWCCIVCCIVWRRCGCSSCSCCVRTVSMILIRLILNVCRTVNSVVGGLWSPARGVVHQNSCVGCRGG